MGSGDLDFFTQVPITVLLAPVFFGVLYVISMIIVFRRAAERRRKARAARGEDVPPKRSAPEKPKQTALSRLGGLMRTQNQQPAPAAPADWTVPAELRGVPEPELDLLMTPVMMQEVSDSTPGTPEFADVDENADEIDSAPASHDWLAGVAASMPSEEATPVMSTIDTNGTPVENEPADAVEVLRIWRDLSDGSLIVQMGGQRYRALEEVQSPELARRFTALVRELNAMIGGGPKPGVAPLPSTGEPGTMPGSLKARLEKRGGETDPQKSSRLQKMMQQVRGTGSMPAQQGSEPAGIANAVEEFLQFKLANSPEFAARSIHIRPSHDQGVSIEVDGHYYDSIANVVDPDVREFLYGLMKEWEARQ